MNRCYAGFTAESAEIAEKSRKSSKNSASSACSAVKFTTNTQKGDHPNLDCPLNKKSAGCWPADFGFIRSLCSNCPICWSNRLYFRIYSSFPIFSHCSNFPPNWVCWSLPQNCWRFQTSCCLRCPCFRSSPCGPGRRGTCGRWRTSPSL